MKNYKHRGKTPTDHWTLADWLREGQYFSNDGRSFRGIPVLPDEVPFISRGELPRDEWDALQLRADGLTYLVYSYNTVIAYEWCGEWHSPDVQYSNTTSYHQCKIRTAINTLKESVHLY